MTARIGQETQQRARAVVADVAEALADPDHVEHVATAARSPTSRQPPWHRHSLGKARPGSCCCSPNSPMSISGTGTSRTPTSQSPRGNPSVALAACSRGPWP
ncbi:hypothetical protein ACFQ0O_25230 [Saccharopolyspora spinosporotrichia]